MTASTPSSRRRRLVLLTTLPLAALVALGPRPAVVPPDRAAVMARIPTALDSLPRYLAQEEAAVGGVHANTEKRIRWAPAADSQPHRTARAVVYLHGFSATRQETDPFATELARALGANLFETRLSGHGLPGAAMGAVTAQDWLTDAIEALTIGQRLGDSVIVVGTSTGGTLALWLAAQPAAERAGLSALVLISPNIAIKDPTARVLTWPWMSTLLPLAIPERRWTARNAEQAQYWTLAYPSTVLFPMAALVAEVRTHAAEHITTPVLLFTNRDDQVVDAGAAAAFFDRVHTARVERVAVTPASGEDGHVLAGRIVAPSQVAPFLARTRAFLQSR